MNARLPIMLALILLPAMARAEDWPKWMGPRGDNTSKEEGVLTQFPETGPKKLWEIKTGIGLASPAAVDGKIYLFYSTPDKKQDVLTCIDAASGKELWKQASDGAFAGPYPGTRCTPNVEGSRIYTYGGAGDLICRELADGKLVWQLNILKETSAKNHQWGISSNPLIVGDLIYVQGGVDGPAAIAVNKKDGKVAWKSEAIGGSYASIIQVDVQGTKQLIVFALKKVYGMNPETGKTIWAEAWETKWDLNGMTPVYRNGKLFVASDYQKGCMMLELSPTAAKKLWENTNMMAQEQPCILEGDVLYGNSEGILRCLDWATGAIKWDTKAQGKSMLNNGGAILRFAGDKMLIQSDRGKLTLAKVTPAGFEKISQADLFENSETWAMPLIYNKKLYLKSDSKDEGPKFVCFEFAAQ